nr:hypothetical protein Iba_chr14cCG0990 [Ipomoea batatas]
MNNPEAVRPTSRFQLPIKIYFPNSVAGVAVRPEEPGGDCRPADSAGNEAEALLETPSLWRRRRPVLNGKSIFAARHAIVVVVSQQIVHQGNKD